MSTRTAAQLLADIDDAKAAHDEVVEAYRWITRGIPASTAVATLGIWLCTGTLWGIGLALLLGGIMGCVGSAAVFSLLAPRVNTDRLYPPILKPSAASKAVRAAERRYAEHLMDNQP